MGTRFLKLEGAQLTAQRQLNFLREVFWIFLVSVLLITLGTFSVFCLHPKEFVESQVILAETQSANITVKAFIYIKSLLWWSTESFNNQLYDSFKKRILSPTSPASSMIFSTDEFTIQRKINYSRCTGFLYVVTQQTFILSTRGRY
jgi:hypothetical protein